jgi:hypothetical protein
MGKIEKDLTRKKKNEHFIRAFEYVAECKGMNQTQLAAAIGSKVAYISVFRNGVRPVPEDTMDELVRVSATIEDGAGQIYKPYLLGLSDYMLLRNVPDDEIVDAQMRKSNPDYDLMKARREAEFENFANPSRRLDESSYLNALLSKSDETIASLKREIASKDEIIAKMEEQHKRELAQKDEIIEKSDKIAEERLHRIAELRRFIDSHNLGLPDFPFTPGVADKPKQKRI